MKVVHYCNLFFWMSALSDVLRRVSFAYPNVETMDFLNLLCRFLRLLCATLYSMLFFGTVCVTIIVHGALVSL